MCASLGASVCARKLCEAETLYLPMAHPLLGSPVPHPTKLSFTHTNRLILAQSWANWNAFVWVSRLHAHLVAFNVCRWGPHT